MNVTSTIPYRSTQGSTPRFYNWLARPAVTAGLLGLPIAAFGYYFLALRLNVLWFDEYENIPYFLTRFLRADTWPGRLDALLRPNNEHRLLYQRLVVLGQYWLTGRLDFNGLMLWGNLGLLVILYLFYRTLRRQNLPVVYLLPIPPVLFIAQNYLLTFTALYTLQYLAIIMLALGTLYCLANATRLGFAAAVVLAIVSTFSMGNGLLVWPVGAVVLACQRQGWKRLAVWGAAGAGAVWGYFYGYPVQQGNTEGFAFVLTHPFQTISGFLIYAGSLLDLVPDLSFENRTWLPLAGGIVLVSFLTGWTGRVLVRSLTPRHAALNHFDGFMLGCVLFLLANTLLIALFRIRFGFMMVLWSSYRTYILVLWAVAYLLLVRSLSASARVRLLPVAWLITTGICAISYLTYLPEAFDRRYSLQGLAFNQHYSHIGLGGSRNTPLAAIIDGLTTDMERRGWYALPKPALGPGEEQLTEPVRDTLHAPALQLTATPDYLTVFCRDAAYKADQSHPIYVALKSDARTYVMSAHHLPAIGQNPFRHPPGFLTFVPCQMLQPGRYRLGVFRLEDGKGVVRFSTQFADVK